VASGVETARARQQALTWNVGTIGIDAKGETQGAETPSVRVPMQCHGADWSVIAVKSRNGDRAKGPGCPPRTQRQLSGAGGAMLNKDQTKAMPLSANADNENNKPFVISKQLVWQAYKKVKANAGAAGIDNQSIADFEKNLKDNLYKLWNRMSSGTYFPPPIRAVEIPKKGKGTRTLGIPTVADRMAQTGVKMVLEVEPTFHPDSYGYRPNRSALDAVGVCRERCWKNDWVVDLDIKAFFDNVRHDLVLDLVKKHTQEQWILLLIKRWLKAPMVTAEGKMVPRDRGTPQGSAVSPLIANIVMHYVFDEWMREEFPFLSFERYCDDVIVHAKSRIQAKHVKACIAERLEAFGLQLHPDKTRIVYCKDSKRKGSSDHEHFDFCGYTFRPRRCVDKTGKAFVGFMPAVSNGAIKAIRARMRSWKLHRRSDKSLSELAAAINAVVQGWIKPSLCQ
jgi:RNA-directed DNA polymerase